MYWIYICVPVVLVLLELINFIQGHPKLICKRHRSWVIFSDHLSVWSESGNSTWTHTRMCIQASLYLVVVVEPHHRKKCSSCLRSQLKLKKRKLASALLCRHQLYRLYRTVLNRLISPGLCSSFPGCCCWGDGRNTERYKRASFRAVVVQSNSS